MRLVRLVKNAVSHVRRNGPLDAARYAIERLRELYHEWRLGIHTAAAHGRQFAASNPFSAHYYPSDYPSIYRALRQLPVQPPHTGFLDYGCGMGRVLVVAGTFPFCRVIGVEISPELSQIARENLERARRRLKCQDIEVITTDAATYQVPSDIHVIFFYNPFHGPVLSSALRSIQASLVQAPRKLWIVFKNVVHLQPVLSDHPWLTPRDEFPASDGDHKIMILEGRLP